MLVELCERFQECKNIPLESIQTVTAGLTLFGMRGSHVDIPSMLASWEQLKQQKNHARAPHHAGCTEDSVPSSAAFQHRLSMDMKQRTAMGNPQGLHRAFPGLKRRLHLGSYGSQVVYYD